jgi:myosin-5
MAQLCDGASSAERASWQLGGAAEYHYLNQSSCTQLKGVDNAAEYKVLLPLACTAGTCAH